MSNSSLKQRMRMETLLLHWASYNGHLEVVEYLVEEVNADPFIKNNSGHDCIYEAELGGQTEVENWYLKKFTPEDAFRCARKRS